MVLHTLRALSFGASLSPTPVPRRQVPDTLRVLHLDSGRAWRGGQRQVQLLAAGLRTRGHEPLVVVQPRSPLYRHLKADGLAVATVAMRAAWDLLAVRQLRRLLTTWRPALVHAHDPRSHSLALTALVGRRHAIPLVVTRRLPQPPRGLRRASLRVARYIAISGAVRDALRRGGVAEERISLVYPGVTRPSTVHPRDWRQECGWPADCLVAGIVGPLAAVAGLTALERITVALRPAVASRLRYVLLGGPSGGRTGVGGIEAYRAGYVHDVHHAIAGLDLMLHPGTAEGLGTAVIDGMALGVPSVAFDGGSVAEVLDSGRDGLLVPAGDDRAFAGAVGQLVEDASLRQRLAKAGPARAARFAPERFVEDTIAIYRDLIARSGV